MKYRTLVSRASLVAMIASLLCVQGCMPGAYGRSPRRPYQQPVAAASRGWATYRIAPGLGLSLPASPQSRTERGRANDGALITTTFSEAGINYPHVMFRSFVTEFEGGIGGDLTDHLDEIVDAFIERSEDMEVRSAEAITTRGFPGIELDIWNPDTQVVFKVRHYIGRTRAYTVGATYHDQVGERGMAFVTYFFEHITIDMADAPVPAGDARLDTNAWVSIFPPETDFAIQMPGQATTETVPFKLGTDETESTVYRVGAPADPVRFSVHVTPIGEMEVEGLLARLRDQRIELGYRVRESRDSQRQGYAAVAVVSESTTELVYSLYVLTMSRIYEARVVVPRDQEATIMPHRQRFFQSLRIL